MKNDAKKNMVFLALAGLVLVVLNTAVFMATKNGHLAPISNLMLWGAFVVLNVCSLLWAVSLLGLQPMVVAVSYVAGGFVAFQGVRLLPEVNVAEITTAGATYGAFGALVVGNATTKVRLAFFSKGQIPFVFVVAALLLMDGFLNSSVSSAGWGVILNALVLPFVLAGGIVGVIWMALGRFVLSKEAVASVAEPISETLKEDALDDAVAELMIRVPEQAEKPAAKSMPKPVAEPVLKPEPVALKVVEEPAKPEPVAETDFFPLEIDKGEEIILPQETLPLEPVLAERTPEPVKTVEPVHVVETPQQEAPPILESEPVSESEEEKPASQDWLSGHLDLLNNIKKAS